jgi:hypothetical protein
MSCDRALRLELADFLASPRAEAFRDFREHYPRCAECAAEVRAWSELERSLAAAHPEAETLARYRALAAGERARVDRHLAGCASCREELALLADFDPERLRAAAAAPAAAGPRETGLISRWLAGLGRVLWHPGFAYALALLLSLPLVYRSVGPWGERVEVPAFDAAREREAPVFHAMQKGDAPMAAADRLEPREPVPAEEALERAREMARSPEEAPRDLEGAARPLEGAAAPQAALREEREPTIAAAPAFERSAAEPEPSAGAPAAKSKLRGEASTAGPAPAPAMAPAAESLRAAARPDASDTAERADLLASAPPPAAAPRAAPPELELRAGELVEARLPAAAPALVLRLPVPASAEAGVEAEVRVTSPDGRRELRERLRLPPGAGGGAGPARLELPRDWLGAGVHRVELHLRDAPGVEPQIFSFRVGGP